MPSKANVADLPVRDPSTWDGEARGVVWPRYTRASTRKASDGVSCDFLLRLSSATPQRCCAESACWPQGSRPDHLSNCDLTTSAQAPSSAACHPRSPFLPLRLCGGGPIQHAWANTWRLTTRRSCGPPRLGRRSIREVVAACGAPEPPSLTAHFFVLFCVRLRTHVCGPHQTYAISSWGPCVRRGHQSVQHGLVRVRKELPGLGGLFQRTTPAHAKVSLPSLLTYLC